ncbi:MAG: DUF4268 domain-containing protein [Phormidesmis sp.]
MPSIIETLALENQTLVTVTENDSAQHALSRMIEHDFSQLPVVDEAQKLKGMITSDSILRAVSYFKVTLEKLKVSHSIIVKATAHLDEEDLPELLRGLRDASAIPIVDRDRKVIAIVTHYDTAKYFRHRAADLMLAKDIELTLRDLILSASNSDTDEADSDALTQLIQVAMPSDKAQKKRFRNALMSYIGKAGIAKHALDQPLLNSVFDQHFKESAPQKPFKKLTLSELIRIVQNLWPTYQAYFNDMPWEVVGPMLDDVRKTRNAIAHFNEVTDEQRKQLQFCADFLDNHRPTIEAPETVYKEFAYGNFIPSPEVAKIAGSVAVGFAARQLKRAWDIRTNGNGPSLDSPSFNPPEEIEANDSRYAPLALWLQKQETDRITCTFKEIESILQDELPPSARQHRNWWANTLSHTQSIQWTEVGWRVSSVNMSTERVVFSRMGNRSKAYINFFNRLQDNLQLIKGLSIQSHANPQGRNWSEFLVMRENDKQCQPLLIWFSFTRKSRFRMEIYINERNQKQNKTIFDQLYAQKIEIEKEFSAELSWERLRDRHGASIACYRPNSSIENTEELDKIQAWAVETLPKFYAALFDRFTKARKEVQSSEED